MDTSDSGLDEPGDEQQTKRLELGTLPETIGEADLEKLNLALRFLFGRLREARAQFEQKGDNGRLGACNALGALWQFITLFRAPYAQSLQVPILRLQDALASLEQNRVEPIVQPVQRTGRAPSSDAYGSLKGQAVATVELLVQMGLNPRDARRTVATELTKLGVRPERGSGTVTATTLRNWRDEISSDIGRHTAGAVNYDLAIAPAELATFGNMPKNQARSRARELLAHWIKSVLPELQKPT
jgi:hypothetical protein